MHSKGDAGIVLGVYTGGGRGGGTDGGADLTGRGGVLVIRDNDLTVFRLPRLRRCVRG